jgi:hypothetical protein
LSAPVPDGGPAYSQRIVAVLIDGLRYRAEPGETKQELVVSGAIVPETTNFSN